MHKKFNSILAGSLSALLFIENACVGYAYAADDVSVFKIDYTTSEGGVDASLELGGNLDICGFSAELLYDKSKYSISEESLDNAQIDDSALINDKPSKGKLVIGFTGSANITAPVKVFDLHIDCSGTPSKDDFTLEVTDAYDQNYTDKDYKVVFNWNGEASEETPVTTAVPVPVTTTQPAPATTTPAPATTAESESKTTAEASEPKATTEKEAPVTTDTSTQPAGSSSVSENNIFYVIADNSDAESTLLTFGVRGNVCFAGVDGTVYVGIEDGSLVSKVSDAGGMLSNYDASMKKIRFTYSNPKAKNTVKPSELFSYKLPKLTDKEIKAIKLDITDAYDADSSSVEYSISYTSEGAGEIVTVPVTTPEATTTVPVTTVTEPAEEPASSAVTGEYKPGDANLDGLIDMSDIVLVKQVIANPEKYQLSDIAFRNADVYQDGVIDENDGDTLQKFIAKIITELPVIPGSAETTTTPAEIPTETEPAEYLPGDVNLNGIVDISDSVAIKMHLEDPDEHPLSDAAKKNADVYQDGVIDDKDADTIQKYLAKLINSLPVIPAEETETTTVTKQNTEETTTVAAPTEPSTLCGDVNMDGKVDITDSVQLKLYLADETTLSDQALLNADVYQDGSVDSTDSDTLTNYIAKLIDKLPVIPDEPAETTTIVTSTAPVTTTEPVTTTPSTIPGDVNMDGGVDITDAVVVGQYLAGAMTLSDQALKNADVYKDGDIDSNDEETLRKYIAKLIDKLPVIPEEVTTTVTETAPAPETTTTPEPTEPSTIPGDINMDGVVDISDAIRLAKHISDPESTPFTAQEVENADVYKDGVIDEKDHDTLLNYTVHNIKELPVIPEEVTTTASVTTEAETTQTTAVTTTPSTMAGDVNMDGIVDISDNVLLSLYLSDPEKTPLSEQAQKNADVYKDGRLTAMDSEVLVKYISHVITKLPVDPEKDIPETTVATTITTVKPVTTTVTSTVTDKQTVTTVTSETTADKKTTETSTAATTVPTTTTKATTATTATEKATTVITTVTTEKTTTVTSVKPTTSATAVPTTRPATSATIVSTAVPTTSATAVPTTKPVTSATVVTTTKPVTSEPAVSSEKLTTSTEKAVTSSAEVSTTAPVTTVTEPVTTIVTTIVTNICGDVNVDGNVDISDLITLKKFLADPENNPLTGQGSKNADVYKDGTIDLKDTETLLNFISKITDELPVIPEVTTTEPAAPATTKTEDTTTVSTSATEAETTTTVTTTTIISDICGDVKMDNSVDVSDVVLLKKYIADPENTELSAQQLKNADTYQDGVIDEKDSDTLLDFVALKIDKLPVIPVPETTTAPATSTEPVTTTTTISKTPGDLNNDDIVDMSDLVALMSHINDAESYPLTDQALTNADVYKDGILDSKDADVLSDFLADLVTALPVEPKPAETTTSAPVTTVTTETTSTEPVTSTSVKAPETTDIITETTVTAPVTTTEVPVTTTIPVTSTEPVTSTDVTETNPVPVTTEPAKTPDYVLGDVNLDGIIDANDASKILEIYAMYSSGATPSETEAQLLAAEVDNDGMITSSDASLILSYYASVSTGEDIKFEDFLRANGVEL